MSIKSSERAKRGPNEGGEVVIHNSNIRIPNWKKFMGNEQNKIRLCSFLVQHLKANAPAIGISKALFIGGGAEDTSLAYKFVGGNWETCLQLFSDHEEADTRMILHAKHAFDNGFHDVTIESPDTDVMVIATYHLMKLRLPIATELKLWFHTGTGLKERYIPLHK